VKNIVLDFGYHIIPEALEECNALLEQYNRNVYIGEKT